MNRTLLEITTPGPTVSGALAGGRLIRHVRERSALSQAELARRIGTSRQVVNRWENSVREPSFSSGLSVVGACGWISSPALLALRDEIDKELRKPEHLRAAVGPTHPASLTILGLDKRPRRRTSSGNQKPAPVARPSPSDKCPARSPSCTEASREWRAAALDQNLPSRGLAARRRRR